MSEKQADVALLTMTSAPPCRPRSSAARPLPVPQQRAPRLLATASAAIDCLIRLAFDPARKKRPAILAGRFLDAAKAAMSRQLQLSAQLPATLLLAMLTT